MHHNVKRHIGRRFTGIIFVHSIKNNNNNKVGIKKILRDPIIFWTSENFGGIEDNFERLDRQTMQRVYVIVANETPESSRIFSVVKPMGRFGGFEPPTCFRNHL